MGILSEILIYSKYCKICQEILRSYDTNSFLLLCIDNTNVRKKILDDEQYKIRNVPCILFIYEDGSIEKCENEQVIQYLDQLVTTTQIKIEDDNKTIQNPIIELSSLQDIIVEQPEKKIKEENENVILSEKVNEETSEDLMMTKKPNSSTMNLAQQLQRERENEDRAIDKK